MQTNKTNKMYHVQMSLDEMQTMANLLGSYFTFLANRKIGLGEESAFVSMQVLNRWKKITEEAEKEVTIHLECLRKCQYQHCELYDL